VAPVTGLQVVGGPGDDVGHTGADLLVAAGTPVDPVGSADRTNDVLLATPLVASLGRR
jgi:hypothetical protein